VRLCERNCPADTKVSEVGGGRAPGARAEIPLQPMEKTVVRQAVLAAHGGPWWSRYPPAAHGGPHAGAGGCLKEAVTPWGARAGAGSCQDLWREAHTGAGCHPVLEQPVPEGLHPMGRTHFGEVHEGLSPMEGTPCRSRGKV